MASQCFAARTSAIFVHGMVCCRVPTILKLRILMSIVSYLGTLFLKTWYTIGLVYNLCTNFGQLTLNSQVLINKGETANIDVS